MAGKHCLSVILCLSAIMSAAACSSNDIDYKPPAGNTETAIAHYSFGHMVIDGKTYESDLAILPGGKICRWSFGLNHEISPDNLGPFLSDQVKTIIIGRGYAGNAHLTASAEDMIEIWKSKGIKVHAMPSGKALVLFNASSKNGLLSFFHLNC
jgi:hypothetical protein